MGFRELAYALGIIILAIYTAIKERREWVARKRGLPRNPERCEVHALRLADIEKDITYIQKDIEEIRKKIG